MARKQKEEVIDGLKVHVTQLPAIRGLKLQLKIGKLIIPLISKLDDGSKKTNNEKSILDTNIDMNVLGKALEGLATKLSEDVFLSLVYQILEGTTVDNHLVDSEDKFNLVFEGKLLAMYKCLKLVLEVEFGDFLGVGGIGKSLKRGVEPLLNKTINR